MKKIMIIASFILAFSFVLDSQAGTIKGTNKDWYDNGEDDLGTAKLYLKHDYQFSFLDDDKTYDTIEILSSSASPKNLVKINYDQLIPKKMGNVKITMTVKQVGKSFYRYEDAWTTAEKIDSVEYVDEDIKGDSGQSYISWMKLNHPSDKLVKRNQTYTYQFEITSVQREKMIKKHKKAKHKAKKGKYSNVILEVGKDIKPGKYKVKGKEYKYNKKVWHGPGKYYFRKGEKVHFIADDPDSTDRSAYTMNKYKNFATNGYLAEVWFDDSLQGTTRLSAWYELYNCGFYTTKKAIGAKGKFSVFSPSNQYKEKKYDLKKLGKRNKTVTLKKGMYIQLSKEAWFKKK